MVPSTSEATSTSAMPEVMIEATMSEPKEGEESFMRPLSGLSVAIWRRRLFFETRLRFFA